MLDTAVLFNLIFLISSRSSNGKYRNNKQTAKDCGKKNEIKRLFSIKKGENVPKIVLDYLQFW